ncbi:MAG: GIY-YIG nuclease family protein [Vicinamibacterales bacterium]
MAWVYLLECADHSLYVGATADLAGRLADHQAGRGGAFTSRRRPVLLVHSEEFTELTAAFQRERQIKKWTTKKKQALIRGDIAALRRLARRTPRNV